MEALSQGGGGKAFARAGNVRTEARAFDDANRKFLASVLLFSPRMQMRAHLPAAQQICN